MKQKLRLRKFCDFEQGQPTLASAERIALDLSQRTHPDVPARALRREVAIFESVPTTPPAIVTKLREKFG